MRLSSKEIKALASGKVPDLFPAFYDEMDGMASQQCLGEGQPSAYMSHSGILFFPTANGISMFDLSNRSISTDPPDVFMDEIRVDDHFISSKKSIKLPHRTDYLEFHFTAIDFSAPEKIRFKYKLEGFELEFKNLPYNSERSVRYTNLKPGLYCFMVKAANNDGIWTETGAFFEFEILPPFHQKPFFYFLLIMVIVLLSGSLFFLKHHKKQIKNRNKYKTVSIAPDRIEKTVHTLLRLMEEEKLYLDPDLTLNKLSQKLRIHYNQLSRVINERFGLSYNDFINKYRIEAAKQKLISSQEKERTILDIIYSTGFYSKSVFNQAFKKFTGMTPSEFRKKHL